MRTKLRSCARHAVPAICMAAICSGLLACSSTEPGQKQAQGQEMGSIIGNMVAPYIGGGSTAGQLLQANAGTIGGTIGAALDEEDRKQLEESTRAAFASGQPKWFSNRKTGVRATVKVTATRVNDQGRQCRTVRQDVKLKDGTALSDDVSACKGPNGNWEV